MVIKLFSLKIQMKRVIHSKSDNNEVMTYNDLKEIIEELFESLLSRYQIGLEI